MQESSFHIFSTECDFILYFHACPCRLLLYEYLLSMLFSLFFFSNVVFAIAFLYLLGGVLHMLVFLYEKSMLFSLALLVELAYLCMCVLDAILYQIIGFVAMTVENRQACGFDDMHLI